MALSSSFCLNDLAPKDARMALETVRFAEEELFLAGHDGLRGSRLLVAFSGGADSCFASRRAFFRSPCRLICAAYRQSCCYRM